MTDDVTREAAHVIAELTALVEVCRRTIALSGQRSDQHIHTVSTTQWHAFARQVKLARKFLERRVTCATK
jgi:hypothetical protein